MGGPSAGSLRQNGASATAAAAAAAATTTDAAGKLLLSLLSSSSVIPRQPQSGGNVAEASGNDRAPTDDGIAAVSSILDASARRHLLHR